MKNKTKKELAALIFGVACFALIALLVFFNIFSNFQLKIADNLYSSKKVSDDIVIVQIDDKSLDENTGLGHFTTWTRDYYAKVIDNINKYGPKVIGIDVAFESSKDEEGDLQLAESLREVENPVLIFRGIEPYYKDGKFITNTKNVSIIEQLRNIKTLTIAPYNIISDSDEVIRRMIPGIYDEIDQKFYDSFSFKVVKKYLGIEELDVPLEEGEMIMNYFSDPGGNRGGDFVFSEISFADLYYGFYENPPNNLFKDKIVLIGPTSLYFNDSYITPMDNESLMPGIQIHANAIQTILEQKFLRNETLPEKLIFLLLLSLVSSFIFMLTRIRWSVLFLILAGTGYYFSAPFMFEQGVILDLIYPYLALVLVFISVYMYRYMSEFKEKLATKRALLMQVNPVIAEKLANNPDRLREENRGITVVFTDIVNYSGITEKYKHKSGLLGKIIREYHTCMEDVVNNENGTLDKYGGDSMMFFFGAPLEQENHAIHACSVVLKMRQALQLLMEKWDKEASLPNGEKKPVIDFRCGVNTGEAQIGNYGSNYRFSYTAWGDTIDVAARFLESANKIYETSILIGEATYNYVKDHFETREIDSVEVAGKTKGIKIYELLSFKGQFAPEAIKLLKLYNEGLQLYKEGIQACNKNKFEEALAKFEQILNEYPDDGASKLYKQRCYEFKNNPPPNGWDGVYKMKKSTEIYYEPPLRC